MAIARKELWNLVQSNFQGQELDLKIQEVKLLKKQGFDYRQIHRFFCDSILKSPSEKAWTDLLC